MNGNATALIDIVDNGGGNNDANTTDSGTGNSDVPTIPPYAAIFYFIKT
jgi:hypothetical protein